MAQKKQSDLFISWTTISYRSVLLAVLAVFVLLGVVMYILFPGPTKSAMNAASKAVGNLAAKLGFETPTNKNNAAAGSQQAQFTAIDGTVRVKKANDNTWIAADFNVLLDKGDVVQTGAEGIAKIVFADGTNYTLKQDSLIVIEENSTNERAQTNVSVQVTTGTVDLSTATYSSGSKSQVIVAGARASLAPESAAQVRNDARNDRTEILVTKGAGEVARGSEVVRLTDYEKVSFKPSAQTAMMKDREVRPPTLIAPANMSPLFLVNNQVPLTFSWTPVENVRAYRVRISRNPYFSSVVMDKRVPMPELKVSGIGEGAYYWAVQAVDAQGRESVESERNRFTVIPKGTASVAIALELEPFIQHGHVIEIRGRTEPSARVMVNGEEVAHIRQDGTFSHFTPKLPTGENLITVTAHNAKGGVSTQQKKVVIQ